MGLLDDLRQQADSRKSDAQRKAEQQERLAEFFRTTLSPKLLQIYRYLYELTEHLNLLKPEVTGHYRYPTLEQPVALRQGNYQVRSDTQHATQETHETILLLECTRAAPINFTVDKARDVDRCEQTLHEYGVEFHCRRVKDDLHKVTHGDFSVRARVPVTIRFAADIPNAAIQLLVSNFDGFGVRRVTLQPDKVNDALLDNFGNYLLRRKDDFFKLEMTDEERARLRESIAQARMRDAETYDIYIEPSIDDIKRR